MTLVNHLMLNKILLQLLGRGSTQPRHAVSLNCPKKFKGNVLLVDKLVIMLGLVLISNIHGHFPGFTVEHPFYLKLHSILINAHH